MKAAALHLLDLGHRRIALIGGSGVRPALERRAGLEEAFAARSLPPTYTLDEGSFAVEHGAAAMRRLLDLPEPPTAVIAAGTSSCSARSRSSRSGGSRSAASCRSSAATTSPSPISSSPPSRSSAATTSRWAGRQPSSCSAACATHRSTDVVLPTEFVARPSCGVPAR